jgi:hypothetical protein
MNTIADTTGRPIRTRTAPRAAHSRSLHARAARRLAGWWSADPQSTTFRAAIERDRGLLRRVDGR